MNDYKAMHRYIDSVTTGQAKTKVSKDAKIRNRYNQVPHLTQDTALSAHFVKKIIKELISVISIPEANRSIKQSISEKDV